MPDSHPYLTTILEAPDVKLTPGSAQPGSMKNSQQQQHSLNSLQVSKNCHHLTLSSGNFGSPNMCCWPCVSCMFSGLPMYYRSKQCLAQPDSHPIESHRAVETKLRVIGQVGARIRSGNCRYQQCQLYWLPLWKVWEREITEQNQVDESQRAERDCQWS